MRYGFFLFTFIFLLISCIKEDNNTDICIEFSLEEPTLTSDDDYEIFNAILNAFHSDSLRIYQKTETYQGIDDEVVIEELKKRIEGSGENIETLTLKNYVENNDKSYFLDKEPLHPFTLISPEEFDCFFSQESGWENYYNKYVSSTGYLRFFRPGFNIEKSMAFVEYGWYWNYLGAQGYIVMLEKEDNKWMVVRRIPTWVS